MFLTRPFARSRMVIPAVFAALIPMTTAVAQTNRPEIVPSGTVIPVKIKSELSSKTNHPGDRFTAVVRAGRDDAGFPEGTRVEGVVREALPAAEGKPGVLDLDFTRIIFPSGQARTLDGSLVSLDAKSVKRTSDGRLVATTDKGKDRTKFIGIGAGAGLLIGALTKQNTLMSILLGAGAGYAYNELGNKKVGDVNLKADTEFGIRLDRALTFDSTHEPARIYNDDPDFHAKPDDKRYYQRTNPDDREDDRIGIGRMSDDRDVRFGSAKPVLRNDTVLVPMREVARAANFEYTFDTDTKVLRIPSTRTRATVGSRIAIVNGERRRLDVAPEERNGTLYVPLQIVGIAVQGSVYYDKPSKTVVVTTQRRER